MSRCSKCGKNKDEAGYIFSDGGSEFENPDFICISCADKIPEKLSIKEVEDVSCNC